MYTTDIWTILDWAFYGAIRYVLFWVPLVTPFSVDRYVPPQWFRYNSWSDWGHRDDNNGGPDEHWLNSWFAMVVGEFKLLTVAESKPYVDQVRDWLRGIIGGVRSGFGSMGDWLDAVHRMIGSAVPDWAINVAHALNLVRDKLPTVIKYSLRSWDDLWESIKDAVRDWARARYDDAKSWAYGAYSWVLDRGDIVWAWVSDVRDWINDIRRDPGSYVRGLLGSSWAWLYSFYLNGRAVVLSWLGPEWDPLVTFARDALVFYYNLWSRGWGILSQIVDDPRGFVADTLERALEDRW